MYKVVLTKKAEKELANLDKVQIKLIDNFMQKNLIDCYNPRLFGKALRGNKKEFWRYRVGSYRLICRICDDELIILTLKISHRNKAYK